MQSLIFNISFLARHDAALVFAVIYVASALLGNISAFINFWVAFAANFEQWRVLAIFAAVFAGEVTGDCMWYGIGRSLRDTRFGAWIKNRLPGHDRAESALQKKGKKYLYLSKFAYGSAGLVLFSLGWTKMDFRVFFKNSLVSITLALPVVFFMAYSLFSGFAPLTAVGEFKHIERVLLIGVVAFLVLEWLLAKAVRALLNGNGTAEDGK